MTRYQYIEKILRQVYGSQPSDDAAISFNLVNIWLSEGIGLAAKKNYIDAAQLDGIAYVNNGFYTTFKGLAIVADDNYTYKVTLPQIPIGIGKNEGLSSLKIQDNNGNSPSLDCVPLSTSQGTYYRSMRPIQNKILYLPEGKFLYIFSTIPLSVKYTATVRMISGGDSTNLDSELNVPDDYLPTIDDFIRQQLMIERTVKQDFISDGTDQS